MVLDPNLKEVIDEADAITASVDDVQEINEYIDDRTYIFCGDATPRLGYGLFDDGVEATQVGMDALSSYDNVVHVWREPEYGLVCEETMPETDSSSDEY